MISRFFKEEAPFWTRLIVGAIIVYLVLAIPIAGFFIAVIVYCLGIGALVHLYLSSREKPQAATAVRSPRRAAQKAKK